MPLSVAIEKFGTDDPKIIQERLGQKAARHSDGNVTVTVQREGERIIVRYYD
jgi:hypothetical protein